MTDQTPRTTLHEVRGAALSVRTEQEALDFLDWCRYSMDFEAAAPLDERYRALQWALGYIDRHGGVDNDYDDIERYAFALAASDRGRP